MLNDYYGTFLAEGAQFLDRTFANLVEVFCRGYRYRGNVLSYVSLQKLYARDSLQQLFVSFTTSWGIATDSLDRSRVE